MIDREKILDDLAKMAGGTASLMAGLSQQIRDEMKTRFDEMASRMNLVPREDFERLEAMVLKLRMEQEELKKKMAPAKATAAKKTPSKPSAKKAVKKPSGGKKK